MKSLRSIRRFCSAGVLTVRQCFRDDREIVQLADRIYQARRLSLDAQRSSAALVTRLETRIRIPARALGHVQRRHDSLSARDRLADLSDLTGFVVRVVARSLSLRRSQLLHDHRRAFVHAPVLTRVDRLSKPPRDKRRPHRLFSKLRRGNARASRLLHEPRARLPRLWTRHLGHHRL